MTDLREFGSMTRMVSDLWLLWRRFTWRHWLAAPRSTVVLVLILALGVGVFLAIRLANRAAVAGFTVFAEEVAGRSDLVLISPAGELPEAVLWEMRAALGVLPAALFPVVETTATEPAVGPAADGFNAPQYPLLGLDLVSLANLVYLEPGDYRAPVSFDERERAGEGEAERWRFGRSRGQVFVSREFSRLKGVERDDTVELVINDRPVILEIVGVLAEREFDVHKSSAFILMDLPAVQALSGRSGWVQRVEVRLPDGPGRSRWLKQAERRLSEAAAGRWVVERPETERKTGETMTKAFRLNLTVLSGLALLVAVYLILLSLEAAVSRRRPEIAVLRSLGVPPRLIRTVWQLEALALGFVGSSAGIVLGWLGAQFSVGAVARTVNSLYYSNTTGAAGWHTGEAALAFGVGLVASGVAGWLPARDAALTPPAQVLQRGVRFAGRASHRPFIGLGLILFGLLLYHAPPVAVAPSVYFPLAGYATALLWVVGSSLLTGPLLVLLARCFASRGAQSARARYALSQLRRPSNRHRLAAAGLLVAVSMAGGMGLLVRSFETTMVTWIGKALRADLYVICQGAGNVSSRNRLPPETWRALVRDPDVEEAEVGQVFPVRLDGVTTMLVGGSHGEASGWRHQIWLEPPGDEDAALVERDGVFPVLVNECFSTRFRKRQGDTVELPTPTGSRRVKIVGIFADYGNERGSILARREYVAEWFDDNRALSVAAYLKPGVDPEEVRRRWLGERPGITVRTNRQLRRRVMEVFHQTFSVTHALKWIGVGVAVLGQVLAMISILLERRRDLATLKELGMSRREVARVVAWEGQGIAAVGLLAGLSVSIALGHLLIYVINKQSFGWTLAFRIPWKDMLLLSLILLTTTWFVSYRVGLWGARLRSDHEE